jgi:curved DNA-binding protein CbpA
MPVPASDPYRVLGVRRDASDAELRAAYRRLVQLHHPDHNGGSAESARRFEEVQDAYARIRELRAKAPPASARTPPRAKPPPRAPSPPPVNLDSDAESRLADLDRAVREAQQARERAQRAAREAAAAESAERPSDEELGYVKTDDSFSKIFTDALSGLTDRISEARRGPVADRVGDLIDELEELTSKVTRRRPPKSG